MMWSSISETGARRSQGPRAKLQRNACKTSSGRVVKGRNEGKMSCVCGVVSGEQRREGGLCVDHYYFCGTAQTEERRVQKRRMQRRLRHDVPSDGVTSER